VLAPALQTIPARDIAGIDDIKEEFTAVPCKQSERQQVAGDMLEKTPARLIHEEFLAHYLPALNLIINIDHRSCDNFR